MKTAIRHIVARTYRPFLTRYLSKTRSYSYEGLKLTIPPAVFHPGFFFSTKLLLNYIRQLDLEGKKFLEPGCGSGLISLYAAGKGALVTATDINPIAIDYLHKNAADNKGKLEIILSDLFTNVPPAAFDIIAINPPYYKKQPQNDRDYAWFCGEKGEYFESLFTGLGNYIHKTSLVLMILFEGCDQEMIGNIATRNGFGLRLEFKKKNLLETNFIYKIERIN